VQLSRHRAVATRVYTPCRRRAQCRSASADAHPDGGARGQDEGPTVTYCMFPSPDRGESPGRPPADSIARLERLVHKRRRVGDERGQFRAVIVVLGGDGLEVDESALYSFSRTAFLYGTRNESRLSIASRSTMSAMRTPARPTLSTKAGPTPRPVVPIAPSPRSFSSSSSMRRCQGMMTWARSLRKSRPRTSRRGLRDRRSPARGRADQRRRRCR
jgi:hypothetical protein